MIGFFRVIIRLLAGVMCLTPFQLQAVDANLNGMSDVWERFYSVHSDDQALDYDGDGFTNLQESQWRTDPWDDSDGPNLSLYNTDGLREVGLESWTFRPVQIQRSTDLKKWEDWGEPLGFGDFAYQPDFSKDAEGYFRLIPLVIPDLDGDGLDADEERLLGTSDESADSDGDGFSDLEEFTLKSNPLASDSDGDGLSDLEEAERGTDPHQRDTDFDGLSDGWEVMYGSDPLVETILPLGDTDGDGIPDRAEAQYGSNPLANDSDGDGIPDGMEVNFLFTDPAATFTDFDRKPDATVFAVQGRSRNSERDPDFSPGEQFWEELLSHPLPRIKRQHIFIGGMIGDPNAEYEWRKTENNDQGQYRIFIPGGVQANLRWAEVYETRDHISNTSSTAYVEKNWSAEGPARSPIYLVSAPDPGPGAVTADQAGLTVGSVSIAYVRKVLTLGATKINSPEISHEETFILPAGTDSIKLHAVSAGFDTYRDSASGEIIHPWRVASGQCVLTPLLGEGIRYGFRDAGRTSHTTEATIGGEGAEIIMVLGDIVLWRGTFRKAWVGEVTFDGTSVDLIADDASVDYSAPHWKDTDGDGEADSTGERRFPVTYVRNEFVKIGAKLRVPNAALFPGLVVKYEGPGGIDSGVLQPSGISGDLVTVEPSPAQQRLPNHVNYYGNFDVLWRIKVSPDAEWEDIGSSRNALYVTREKPIAKINYETLFFISCRNSRGDRLKSDVVNGIWQEFTDLKVKRRDGEQMKYWNPRDRNRQNLSDLLDDNEANGTCAAWAFLLKEVLASQGIDSNVVEVESTYRNDHGKTFGSDSTNRGLLLIKSFILGDYNAPAEFFPFVGILSQGKPLDGSPGQGNSNPPPAFMNHYITYCEGKYFDPSYGLGPFYSAMEWQYAALDGFAKIFSKFVINTFIYFELTKESDVKNQEVIFKQFR